MKTGVILAGVVALASAAPAATTTKGSSVLDAVAPQANGAEEGGWHIGCDNGDKDHKCSYYRGAELQPRSDGYDGHRNNTSTHPYSKPSTVHTTSTSSKTHPGYYGTSKSTSTHSSSSHSSPTSPVYTSTHSSTKSSSKYPVYESTHSSSTSSKSTSSTSPYSSYASTLGPYSEPQSTYYERRGDYYPPPHVATTTQYATTTTKHTTSPSPYTSPTPTPSPSTSSTPSHTHHTSSKHTSHSSHTHHTSSSYSSTTSGYEHKPAYTSKVPAEPTSPPFCDFVNSECIDCNVHPSKCDKCNFLFKCGQKKQCTYHGVHEVMTLCEEKGAECPWHWAGHEYDVPSTKTKTTSTTAKTTSTAIKSTYTGPATTTTTAASYAPTVVPDYPQGPKNHTQHGNDGR